MRKHWSLVHAIADITLLCVIFSLLPHEPFSLVSFTVIVAICRIVVEPTWLVAVAFGAGIAMSVWYQLFCFHHTGDGDPIDARIMMMFWQVVIAYFLFAAVFIIQRCIDGLFEFVTNR